MAASDFITSAFAQQIPQLAALYASSPATLSSLISSASTQVVKYCNRNFVSGSYTVYLSGAGVPYDECILPEFPVQSIQRVAANPVPALLVANTDNLTNQRATVETTSTGINLRRWASGVETDTPSILFASYVTINAVAGQINSAGGGWQATVNGSTGAGGYGNFPSADLRIPQGQVTCIGGGANLELFTEDLPMWVGSYVSPDATGYGFNLGYGWRIDTAAGRLKGTFPPGSLNIRVDYTAGFTTIPLDLQQAVAMQVLFMYQQTSHDFNVQSERLGPYAKTLATPLTGFAPGVLGIINRYRDFSKNFWTERA